MSDQKTPPTQVDACQQSKLVYILPTQHDSTDVQTALGQSLAKQDLTLLGRLAFAFVRLPMRLLALWTAVSGRFATRTHFSSYVSATRRTNI
jgi:hypothetical protein